MVLDLMEKDSFFLHPSDETGKNPINFEVDINLQGLTIGKNIF